jgi:hypothetical protein
MEQYWMPRKLDFKNLRACLDMHGQDADRLFVRLVGSMGGTHKVDEALMGRTLDFRKHPKKDGGGISLLVDGKEAFRFPLMDVDKGFSLAYERFHEGGPNTFARMVMLSHGEDPYDPSLPEPTRSVLRQIWDDHLVEIHFSGRINLKFHSWWNKERTWKLWTIAKERPAPRTDGHGDEDDDYYEGNSHC